MNAKGRVKEDWAFKFYQQDSSLRGMSYHARRDARRTTYDARPTTHDPRRTTHDARPHYPHTHGMLEGSKGTLREQSSSA